MYRWTLSFILLAASLYAQSFQGGIRGLVTDAGGGAVAGAKVSLVDEGTNSVRATLTNESGEYVFNSVVPATYTVSAESVIRDARRRGFASVSFDLMLWLPGQTPDSWRRTVDRAIALEPDHLSLYLLELYPNAPLKEAMARSGWSQTPDDDAAEMYLDGLARLDAAGYQQYEISNVARPGHRSRHNVKYWQSGDWLGLGCGAHSTVDGVRWKNVAGTAEYVDRIGTGQPVVQDRHTLTPQARVEEAVEEAVHVVARGVVDG